MATRKNNISKQIQLLAQILISVKFLRFFFFFYSFLSFIFWFLNCFEVDWLYLFNWLFVFPYQLINTFYKPEGMSADFTLAIIGGISLFLGFFFDFISNIIAPKIVDLKEKEEKIKQARQMQRKRTRKKTVVPGSVQTEQNDILNENNTDLPQENPKLLFIITPHINKIKKNEDDLEFTFQDIELWKQRVNKKLLENVNYSKPLQKGYYRKNLFLMYKDFNYVDDFIYYIKPTLESIVIEFKKYGVAVSYCYVLSTISDTMTLEKELDCMDTVLSLNFINDLVVTNRFKIIYDNKPTRQYTPIIKGEYNLSKNLTVTNRQPLFSLTSKEKEHKL